MRGTAKSYDQLHEYIQTIPLIDCHDHTGVCGPKYIDPIRVIIAGYFSSDLHSVSSDAEMKFMQDWNIPMEKRWPSLEKAWKKTCHTGYAQVTRRILKKFYDEDDLTLDALKRMEKKVLDIEDPKIFDQLLEDAKIKVRLINTLGAEPGHQVSMIKDIVKGTYEISPRGKMTIPLRIFHDIRSYADLESLGSVLDRHITSLDEYLDLCRDIFEGYKQFGSVAFKDQSAYNRTLNYENPTRSDAEKIFNYITANPRQTIAYPKQSKPLDDYLFHHFMRIARELDLPVQLHTGHMAGIRNDIEKANAVKLTSLIELHRDVRFDLFHANWPYSAEIIFMAKNYPNVTIDFCWTNIIDPIYCQNMFKQILSAVPHGKIHGYGSDYNGLAERSWAHAEIARENIAIALSDMVEIDYINMDHAKQIACDWLFNNPNEFFRLNLKL